MPSDGSASCANCGSALVPAQRYCLTCGERASSRSPQLQELLARSRGGGVADADTAATLGTGPDTALAGPQRAASGESATTPDAATPDAATADAAARPAAWRAGLPRLSLAGLRLPPARISLLLVLAFLGFGVIVGGAAGSRSNDSLSAARRPLRLVLPPASVPAGGESASSSSSPAAQAEGTPSAEAQVEPATPTSTAGGAAEAHGGTGGGTRGTSRPSGATGSGTAGSGAEGSTGAGGEGKPAGGGGKPKLPAIKHVFVVMLDDQPYAGAFGPASAAHYLEGELEPKGALLVRYYAVAHEQLANAIALISGQGPTQQIAQNCPTFEDIVPGTAGAQEQVIGQGCVYPTATKTLPGQLKAKGLTWRAYVQGMDEGQGEQPACGHPALGAADPSAAPAPPAGTAYATWRNPFVYLQSLTGSSACSSNDVGASQLAGDLGSVSRTPNLAYIVPDLCHDGNPNPCAPGAPTGMAAADGFLREVVPKILASKAFKQNGLLVITTDEAPSSGELADSSSCCGQPEFPNLPASTSALGPEGGGQVGALLLSPFIKKHAVSQEPYNHFSLLRTIENLFGVSPLGFAGAPKVTPLQPSLLSTSG